MKISKKSVWVVAYINSKLAHKLINDLSKKRQYRCIEFKIPMVRVLKKTLKNKHDFKEVPLLMNYGFFKIPINWAINIDLLNGIKNDINCISNWVKDRAKVRIDEDDDNYNPYSFDESDVPIATVTEGEIAECCRMGEELSIFSSEDINRLSPGDIVILTTYPFESIPAKVLEINLKTEKIWVALRNAFDETGDSYDMRVEVHFDNVFYSVYQGSHDENYGVETLLEDYQVNRKKPKTEDNED